MIVDAHAHIFAAAGVLVRSVDELAPAERSAPVELLREQMSAAGVDRAVLVPLTDEDAYVGEARLAGPGTFAAIAVAGPAEHGLRAGVDPIEALEARRRDFPFEGLRSGWLGEPGRPLAESPALPALRWLAERGLPLWSYPAPDQLELLLELPATLPDLPIVLNHLGFFPTGMEVDRHGRPSFADPLPPDQVTAVLGLARHPRVHIMLSGQYALSAEPHPHRDLDDLLRRALDAFGPRRAMWGSDFPWVLARPGYAETLGLLDSALPDLDGADREEILGGTALRLFPSLEAGS